MILHQEIPPAAGKTCHQRQNWQECLHFTWQL